MNNLRKMALNLFNKNVIIRNYRSAICLENLYPNSVNVKPFEPPAEGTSTFNGYIPVDKLDISYTRSSGPGGQNVNKTSTKVDVRFHVDSAKWLSPDLRNKLKTQQPNKINKEGYFIIRSEKTKIQHLNQADAIARLRDIVFKLDTPELTIDPETAEKIRKNKEKAIRMRLMEKRQKSAIKNSRRLDLN